MAKVVVTDSKLQDVANSIRSKTGSTGTMTLEQMPSKIDAIITGDTPNPDFIIETSGDPSGGVSNKPITAYLYVDHLTGNTSTSSLGMYFWSHYSGITAFKKTSEMRLSNLISIFEGCDYLKNLDVSFIVPECITEGKGVKASRAFYKAGVQTLDLSPWDGVVIDDGMGINKPTQGYSHGIKSFLQSCSNLSNLTLPKFDTSNVLSFDNVFSGCTSLTSIDLSHWDTTCLWSSDSLFYYCSKLESVNLSNFVNARPRNCGWMFYGCNKLTNIIWPAVWDMSRMYSGSSDQLRLDPCPLTRDSIVQLFNALVDATGEDYKGQKSLKINAITYDSLSAEDLAIATNKGYAITK